MLAPMMPNPTNPTVMIFSRCMFAFRTIEDTCNGLSDTTTGPQPLQL